MHAIAFKVPLRDNTGMLIARPQALEGRLGGGVRRLQVTPS